MHHVRVKGVKQISNLQLFTIPIHRSEYDIMNKQQVYEGINRNNSNTHSDLICDTKDFNFTRYVHKNAGELLCMEAPTPPLSCSQT